MGCHLLPPIFSVFWCTRILDGCVHRGQGGGVWMVLSSSPSGFLFLDISRREHFRVGPVVHLSFFQISHFSQHGGQQTGLGRRAAFVGHGGGQKLTARGVAAKISVLSVLYVNAPGPVNVLSVNLAARF